MSPATAHTFPASQALQLVPLVRRWGISADELFDGVGLNEAELEAPHARISVETLRAVLERARALTAEPGIGFYMGMQKRLAMYGYLGFAAMSAATLREGIELAVRYAPIVSTAVSLALCVNGDRATLTVDEHVDMGSTHDIAVFSLLVGMRQLTSVMTGQELGDSVTDVPLERPSYFERFAHLVPGVRFGQPKLRLHFAARALDLPLLAPDRAALALAREACERQLEALGFERQLHARVRRLVNGPDGLRSIEAVARTLRLSTRTLKRKLAADGESFSSLVEREREEQALELLRTTELTLAEIAQHLGYSSVPNFARAFRRWRGESPAQFRRSQR